MKQRYLDDAKRSSKARFVNLIKGLESAQATIDGKACVYATGSFGRLEAGPASDLDLFIVVDTISNAEKIETRLLDGIGETKLKFHLISAVENSGIATFDAGGRYLDSHGMDDFTAHLGSQSDDFRNTLTGRLLLLLESRSLLGQEMYLRLLRKVIDAYFQDYVGNESSFIPSFLINDILRLWRTFCVNYEFARKKGSDDIKIKNLKLKFSRMLTCYSAIVYLLSVFGRGHTVSPDDVMLMASLTPVERLEYIQQNNYLGTGAEKLALFQCIDCILDEYSKFLELVHRPKSEVLSAYKSDAAEWKRSSYAFGQYFAEAIVRLGTAEGRFNGLYRMILI